MKRKELLPRLGGIASMMLFLAGCGAPAPVPTMAPPAPPWAASPTGVPTVEGLSAQEAATLGSLKKVDDYPLYTMRYSGAYDRRISSDGRRPASAPPSPAWACSLVAALGDATGMQYGRNFDWEYSPAVLLFTDPPDGYASVSMVDIAYLGWEGGGASTLTDLPLAERRALLRAPFLPFDGMNERGLAVGMAAVPSGDMQPDPNKETIDSLMVIREMLDHAGDVDEAVAIVRRYNISMSGGPPLHYLIADSSGRAALVEFYQGRLVILSNDKPWHLATNFSRSAVNGSAEGQCWRYDAISRQLAKTAGRLSAQETMRLLQDVSQKITQWSIVYGISTGEVNVTMGRHYGDTHTFHLDAGP